MKAALQFLLAGAAVAAPFTIERRQALTDVDILQFALTLEHLENAFYHEAVARYGQDVYDASGRGGRIRQNIGEVSFDEETHVSFLTGALTEAGAMPIPAATYAFGLTDDIESFFKTANILEGVGISAYLGAAAAIQEPAYLTAAGSILTIEARHSAYFRDNQMPPQSPFPTPFDIPLDPNFVFTLASQFITALPEGFTLPFTAYPLLTMVTDNLFPSNPGTTVQFSVTADNPLTGLDLWCSYPYVTGPVFTKATIESDTMVSCAVPDSSTGVNGQAYAILTTSGTELSPSTVAAGPAVIFITANYLVGGFDNPA